MRDEGGEVSMNRRAVAWLRFVLKNNLKIAKNLIKKNLEKNKKFSISKISARIFTGSLRFADYRRWGHVNEYWNFF